VTKGSSGGKHENARLRGQAQGAVQSGQMSMCVSIDSHVGKTRVQNHLKGLHMRFGEV
jgi:hypothetical protein